MTIDLRQAIQCAATEIRRYQAARLPLPERLKQHWQHLHNLADGSADGTESIAPQADSELIGTTEAAQILGCSARFIRRIATDLDGHRIEGQWIFNRKAVTDYAMAKQQAQQHDRSTVD